MTAPHFRDEGAGPPVVLIPGFGASLRSFDGLFERRGEQRLLAIDLPRTGKSTHWAPSTPVGIAQELSSWLTRHRVRAYRVLGHSFGGLAAIELARLAPERVEGLFVASAPALGLPKDAKRFLSNPMAEQMVLSMFQLATWRPAMRTYLQWLWGKKALPSPVVDAYQEAIKAEGFSSSFVEAMRSVAEYHLPIEPLKKAGVPTRVIWGEQDRLVPVVYGEHLATSLGAPFQVLPDVGHCIPEEDPQALAQLIAEPAPSP